MIERDRLRTEQFETPADRAARGGRIRLRLFDQSLVDFAIRHDLFELANIFAVTYAVSIREFSRATISNTNFAL